MAKFQATLYQKSKRVRAFALYQEPDALGKRRSMAAIAQMIGASASAVAYWKRTDEWDNKLLASLEDQLADADKTNLEIKKTLRDGLNRHILTLSRLIADTKLPADKINAIKAFVHVCKELEVLKPDTGIQGELTPPVQFKDDVPHGQPEAADPGPPGEDPSVGEPPVDGGESPDPGDLSAADISVLSASERDDDSMVPADDDHLEHQFRAAGL
jgi:hypothetical protein